MAGTMEQVKERDSISGNAVWPGQSLNSSSLNTGTFPVSEGYRCEFEAMAGYLGSSLLTVTIYGTNTLNTTVGGADGKGFQINTGQNTTAYLNTSNNAVTLEVAANQLANANTCSYVYGVLSETAGHAITSGTLTGRLTQLRNSSNNLDAPTVARFAM